MTWSPAVTRGTAPPLIVTRWASNPRVNWEATAELAPSRLTAVNTFELLRTEPAVWFTVTASFTGTARPRCPDILRR